MASVTIITDICRLSHVHLKEPYKFQEDDDLKYRIASMFPQSGVGTIEKLGIQFPSSRDGLVNAIKQVVLEEFGFEYDPNNLDYTKQHGVQFPPNFKDGNKKFAKDTQGNLVPGSVDPISANNWIININADATEQPGCVHGVTLAPIDPGAIYSGCWGRLQVEVSAYTTKKNARVIAIKLLNVMMCYDDESFGGAGPKQDAASAFAGMAVTNSNLSAGVGQGTFQPMTAPQKPGAPTRPVSSVVENAMVGEMIGQAAGIPVVGAVIGALSTPPSKPTPPKPAPMEMVEKIVMNADSPYTYEQLTKEYGWTDKEIIDGGYATMQKQPAAPSAPVKPVPPTPPAKPVPPKPAPSVPTTGTVIMNPDSPYTYEQLTKEYGWTDKEIIEGGYGKPNFTNPQN